MPASFTAQLQEKLDKDNTMSRSYSLIQPPPESDIKKPIEEEKKEEEKRPLPKISAGGFAS